MAFTSIGFGHTCSSLDATALVRQDELHTFDQARA
jgi:hypothetical protein